MFSEAHCATLPRTRRTATISRRGPPASEALNVRAVSGSRLAVLVRGGARVSDRDRSLRERCPDARSRAWPLRVRAAADVTRRRESGGPDLVRVHVAFHTRASSPLPQ